MIQPMHESVDLKIPFNRACFQGKELYYIAQAIQNGHISGDGPFTRKCHDFLREKLGVADAFLTPSCTHALEMAAILLDLGPDDEFIVTSFTFVSTVSAFAIRGARPVFVDVQPDTGLIDPLGIEAAVTGRTKAIIPVHLYGMMADMRI